MDRPCFSRQQAAGLALLLAAIVALVYHEAPGNQFHFDDYHNIVDYGPVRMQQPSAAALLEAFTNPRLEHRNVASLTFAVDWWRGGGEPRSFLQTNVFPHVLAALALFLFARQVLLRLKPHDTGVVLLAAFGAALIWALHPVNSQAVNLIVQRMTILATLFVLLSLSCYLAARSTAAPRSVAWFAAAGVFGVLGALSKQNAWILPLLVLAVEYGVVRHGQPLVRSRADALLLSLPFVVAALVVIDLASGSGPISHKFLPGYEGRTFTMGERLLTQPRVVFFYLSLVFWPLPGRFSLEHDFAVSTALTSLAGATWAGIHDRRPAYAKVFAAMAAAVALGLALSTMERTGLWQEPLVLNEDAVTKPPNSSRAWSNLGMQRYLDGDQAGAIAALEKALELSGGRERKALEHLGVIYLDLGNLDRAENLIERAYRMQWDRPEPSLLNHVGEVELARKRFSSAAAYFERAIGLAPWKSAYYWNLALAYVAQWHCRTGTTTWTWKRTPTTARRWSGISARTTAAVSGTAAKRSGDGSRTAPLLI